MSNAVLPLDVGRRRASRKALVMIVGTGALFSAIFGALMGASEGTSLMSALQGVLNSVLVSLPIIWLELNATRNVIGRALRRLPFALFVIAKTLAYLLVIVPSIQLMRWLFSLIGHGDPPRFDETFIDILIFASAMSLLANIVISMGTLLGWPTLGRLLTGRYHRPRREERIFLSVDLKESTVLAQRLGDERFHTLINAFFTDIAHGAADTGAEIYKYIGDEAILTWPAERGLQQANCLLCPLAIARHIARHEAFYRRRFGIVPQFRAAMHIGDVIAGEVGDTRREIGYFGDTLNTTARLAAAVKDLGQDILVSEELLRRVEVPPNLAPRSLPPLPVRGTAASLPVATYSLAA
jgi:adenylate cyclase